MIKEMEYALLMPFHQMKNLLVFANLMARGFTVRVVVSVWLAIKRTEAIVSPVYLVPLESTKQHLERENVKSVHRTAKHYLLVRRVSMRQDYYRAVSDPNL